MHADKTGHISFLVTVILHWMQETFVWRELKAQVDRGTKELKSEKQKAYSLQGKVEELERALDKSQRKIQEQTEEINEWQQKENEIKAKQSMQERSGLELKRSEQRYLQKEESLINFSLTHLPQTVSLYITAFLLFILSSSYHIVSGKAISSAHL